MRPAFTALLLTKYQVEYDVCDACGFLQTQEPTWLEEAYTEAISSMDTGVMARNLEARLRLSTLFSLLFHAKGDYVDVGAGYGVLVRLMRDSGFAFYWSDKYASNLFARGMEAAGKVTTAQAIVAFEVIEHVWDPVSFLEEHMDRYRTKTLVLSTNTYSGAPPPTDWWYYSFETGQHLSFFQQRTMTRLAQRLGLKYYSIKGWLHVLTDQILPPWMRTVVGSHTLCSVHYAMGARWRRQSSLTDRDRTLISLKRSIASAERTKPGPPRAGN